VHRGGHRCFFFFPFPTLFVPPRCWFLTGAQDPNGGLLQFPHHRSLPWNEVSPILPLTLSPISLETLPHHSYRGCVFLRQSHPPPVTSLLAPPSFYSTRSIFCQAHRAGSYFYELSSPTFPPLMARRFCTFPGGNAPPNQGPVFFPLWPSPCFQAWIFRLAPADLPVPRYSFGDMQSLVSL